jgi:tetratricopeptide (TPR) repeat protein
MMVANILAVDRLKIDFFPAEQPTRRLLFTFTELTNRHLDGKGYAGEFAVAHGFDLIAIKTSADDWYQSLSNEAFNVVEDFLTSVPQYELRATYGSSMGGYAAIVFANDLKADIAFALSPQFDITQEWDKRWSSYAKNLSPLRTVTPETVRQQCKYCIAYDPTDNDRLHFKKFEEIIPATLLQSIKVPGAGHPVGYFLQAANATKDLAQAIFNGSEAPIVRDKIRRTRPNYANYFYNLSIHCSRRGKHAWAKMLNDRAIKLAPLNSEYHIRAAQIAEMQGKITDAIERAAFAVALAPKHPHMIANLARFLERQGLHKQALHYIDMASALIPGRESFVAERTMILNSINASR